jgi:hypothetical protein
LACASGISLSIKRFNELNVMMRKKNARVGEDMPFLKENQTYLGII